MKSYDAIVVGGGVIGLSLALELRWSGMSVLLLERGEMGREASHAAAGMLAYCDPDTPAAIAGLCRASGKLYPEFARRIEEDSGLRVDYRTQGTIAFMHGDEQSCCENARELDEREIRRLEPKLTPPPQRAVWLPEQTVDNRALVAALEAACRHREVDIATGTAVTAIDLSEEHGTQRATGVVTKHARYAANAVVNCAGAWAAQIAPATAPARPMKGQMLAVLAPKQQILQHTVRTKDVYMVPRSDGRIIIGATVEDAGFDKRVDPEVIQRFQQLGAELLPEVGAMRMLEAWAGLRPGSPDGLPIMGATAIEQYFVATGHFRNGILLSAVTSMVMAELVRGMKPSLDISRFSPQRFVNFRNVDTPG